MKDYFIEECGTGDKYIWQREEFGLGSYRWRQTHAKGIGRSNWELLSYEPKNWHPINIRCIQPEEVFIELL